MTTDDWLEQARIDAASRGLAELEPLLEMLAQATAALRRADWAKGDAAAPEWSARPAPGAGPR